MGVFDEVQCRYPLPFPEVQDALWQTKDTADPYQDLYELRADGTLWHEEYDSRLEFTSEAPLGMWRHRDNPRWVQCNHVGEFEIHHFQENPDGQNYWYSIRFWFKDGKVADMIPTKNRMEN